MRTALKLLLAVAILTVSAVVGGKNLSFLLDGSPRRKAPDRREIALRVLGESLAGEFAGQTALIISNPFTRQPSQPREVYEFEEAGVRGLKEGWGGRIQLREIVFPDLRPEALTHPSAALIDPHTTTPLSFLTAPGAWDSLLAKYPDADLVVSLIGLPADLRSLEIWRNLKPRFALLFPDLRMIGNWAEVQRAVRSGKIAAMVLQKPGSPPEAAGIASDYRKEFDRRFVLVTARNIDEWNVGLEKSSH
ncbi:MAG: hypothetical protein HY735_33340 [Verrucomicrobia bacterium]|nr:hypothetical protein [Verrucomicrobiota bacterium]